MASASWGRQRKDVPQLELILRGTGTILNSQGVRDRTFSALIAWYVLGKVKKQYTVIYITS